MNNLEVIIKDQNIATENAKQLIEAFGAPFTEAGQILSTYKEIVVDNINQKELMAEAKTKRLALKKVRTTVENRRKELKDSYLKTGQAIDSVARYIKGEIEPAEEYLELQEKYAEIQEAKLMGELKQERIEKLLAYTDNPYDYNLTSMSFDDFEKLLQEVKEAKELQTAKDKAYADEQTRIIQEKEAEDIRIRQENEKLREEANAREAELKIERDKREAAERLQEAERQATIKAAEIKEAELKRISEVPNKRKELFDMVYQWGKVGVVTDHNAPAFSDLLNSIVNESK